MSEGISSWKYALQGQRLGENKPPVCNGLVMYGYTTQMLLFQLLEDRKKNKIVHLSNYTLISLKGQCFILLLIWELQKPTW